MILIISKLVRVLWRASAAFVLIACLGGAPLGATEIQDWVDFGSGSPLSGPSWSAEISTDDLLRLRDIGAIAVSPDGSMIAFSVTQADPDRDNYRVRWFVAPVSGEGRPRPLPFDGGQPIPVYSYGLPQAYVAPPVAKWSPDSRVLAVRKLLAGRISLWTIDVRSGETREVANGDTEVENFVWSQDAALIYKLGLNYSKFLDNLKFEGRRGWLFDGRIPLFASYMKPGKPDCSRTPVDEACDNGIYAFSTAQGARSANEAEVSLLTASETSVYPGVSGPGGVLSAKPIVAEYANAKSPMRRIEVATGGTTLTCAAKACIGARFRQLGWTSDKGVSWFLKAEDSDGSANGAPGDLSALYTWNPATNRVRLVRRIDGMLDDCHIAGALALCIEETVRQPRRIIRIDLNSGGTSTLADANPMFQVKRFPIVRKIRLHDSEGDPAFAHLVYPLNYEKGKRYPLVVTQYHSTGFLRGNVGNEYPIYPMAGEGYFVLDVEWPSRSRRSETLDYVTINRMYTQSGRKLVWDVINSGVDQVIAEGLADPNKLAITGLSGGAEDVQYVLQRSSRFAVAIASSGIHDISFFALVPEGPMREDLMKTFATKRLIPPEGNDLYNLAWSRRPETLTTPLLINVGQYEALIGFEGTQTILHEGGPLEMRIFEDESHIKYHPRTYQGIYLNNLQWLKFWLSGKEDAGVEFANQYRRWEAMRDTLAVR